MQEKQLTEKITNAAKWAAVTEIAAKIVSPISNMVLARILVPESFGVVATVTMVFSFADMFTDAGFSKYLIQHEFVDDNEKNQSANVAFWTNILVSLVFLITIIIFAGPISDFLGLSDSGITLIVSCISLPLTSFSSIQMALYKRDFDFKSLFFVRVVVVTIPLFVTVPMAFILKSYWALIIGTIVGNAANAIVLTVKSPWKPNFFYSLKLLNKMFSYSVWTLLESITMWFNGYIDTFIVSIFLSIFYLGLYKTAMTTVNQILNLIVTATTPILFSTLSRLQNNKAEFKTTYLKFQRLVGTLLIPLGFEIFFFRELGTQILLGNQWSEIADFIGLWGSVGTFSVVIAQFASEAYRAMGKPRVAVLSQIIQLIFLLPAVFIGAQFSFKALYILRTFVRVISVVISLILLHKFIHIKYHEVLKNLMPMSISSVIMSIVIYFMKDISDNLLFSILTALVGIVVYSAVLLLLFPQNRKEIRGIYMVQYNKSVRKRG